MNHYKATEKATANVVEYDANLPLPEHLTDGWWLESVSDAAPAPPDTSPPIVGPRRLTKIQFIDRLGDPAYLAILTMAKTIVEIEAFVKRFEMATPDPDGTSIDLDDPRTVLGVTTIGAALEAQSIVPAGWAQGVLNG